MRMNSKDFDSTKKNLPIGLRTTNRHHETQNLQQAPQTTSRLFPDNHETTQIPAKLKNKEKQYTSEEKWIPGEEEETILWKMHTSYMTT